MATQVNLQPGLIIPFRDNNGNVLASGSLATYQAGTTTPLAAYIDSTGTTQFTNPIPLNSRGSRRTLPGQLRHLAPTWGGI